MKSEGTVYFIQPTELKDTKKYKIGMSKKNDLSRFKKYHLGTRFILIMSCKYPVTLEGILKAEFKNKYKLIAGSEYFEGKEEDMLKDFFQIINENKENNLKEKNKEMKLASQIDDSDKKINIIDKDMKITNQIDNSDKEINIIDKDTVIELEEKILVKPECKINKELSNNSEETQKYYCKICQKNYKSNNSLWNHNKKFHPDKKMNNCEKCNKVYSSYKSLWAHNKIFHPKQIIPITIPIIDPKFKCKYCDKIYSSRQNRWKHENTVCENKIIQEQKTIYKCIFCEKIFNDKSNKYKHQKICKKNQKNELEKLKDKIDSHTNIQENLIKIMEKLSITIDKEKSQIN